MKLVIPPRKPEMADNPRMVDRVSAIMILRILMGDSLFYSKTVLDHNFSGSGSIPTTEFAYFLRECHHAELFPSLTKEKS